MSISNSDSIEILKNWIDEWGELQQFSFPASESNRETNGGNTCGKSHSHHMDADADTNFYCRMICMIKIRKGILFHWNSILCIHLNRFVICDLDWNCDGLKYFVTYVSRTHKFSFSFNRPVIHFLQQCIELHKIIARYGAGKLHFKSIKWYVASSMSCRTQILSCWMQV